MARDNLVRAAVTRKGAHTDQDRVTRPRKEVCASSGTTSLEEVRPELSSLDADGVASTWDGATL